MTTKKPIVFFFIFAFAIVGFLFLAYALLLPHQAGTVTSVGNLSTYNAQTGKGRHRYERLRYCQQLCAK